MLLLNVKTFTIRKSSRRKATGDMKITYLYNSGFTVDFGDLLLVFDCVSIDENRCISQGFLNRSYVERFSSVYFFVSHKHADHYSKRIYDFCSKKVKYILASGTPSVPSTAESIVLRRSEKFCDDTLQVKAYGSTDLGVSFLIRARGVTLFFAGDLNCWHWTSQCPYDEERAARQAFTDELLFIKEDIGEAFSIDVAFFPVDPRMKGGYDDGALEFCAMFQPTLFVPMHFREEVAVPALFAQKVDTEVFIIKKQGAVKEFNK